MENHTARESTITQMGELPPGSSQRACEKATTRLSGRMERRLLGFMSRTRSSQDGWTSQQALGLKVYFWITNSIRELTSTLLSQPHTSGNSKILSTVDLGRFQAQNTLTKDSSSMDYMKEKEPMKNLLNPR